MAADRVHIAAPATASYCSAISVYVAAGAKLLTKLGPADLAAVAADRAAMTAGTLASLPAQGLSIPGRMRAPACPILV